jgi:hypothetical protein
MLSSTELAVVGGKLSTRRRRDWYHRRLGVVSGWVNSGLGWKGIKGFYLCLSYSPVENYTVTCEFVESPRALKKRTTSLVRFRWPEDRAHVLNPTPRLIDLGTIFRRKAGLSPISRIGHQLGV